MTRAVRLFIAALPYGLTGGYRPKARTVQTAADIKEVCSIRETSVCAPRPPRGGANEGRDATNETLIQFNTHTQTYLYNELYHHGGSRILSALVSSRSLYRAL